MLKLKKKKRHAAKNGKDKTDKGLGYNTWCKKKIKEAHKGDKRKDLQRTGAVAVMWFLSNSEHIFTCSGGGFCPGLGEEVLVVAAAGLVGLCCFARRIRNFVKLAI